VHIIQVVRKMLNILFCLMVTQMTISKLLNFF